MIGRLHFLAQNLAGSDSRPSAEAPNTLDAQPSFATILALVAAGVSTETGQAARLGRASVVHRSMSMPAGYSTAARELETVLPADSPRATSASRSARLARASVPITAARHFSVVVPDDSSDTPNKDRTFGFGDLGMFGLHAPSVAVPQVVTNTGETAAANDAATAAAVKATSGARPELAIASPESADSKSSLRADKQFLSPADQHSAQDTDGVALPGADDIQPSRTPEAEGDETGQISGAVSFGDTIGVTAPASAVSMVEAEEEVAPPQKSGVATTSSPGREASSLVVTISGPDEALAVTVRSQGESADEALRLRALVEDTAREFGADVQEFLLNGAAAGKTLHLTTGGRGGSRSG